MVRFWMIVMIVVATAAAGFGAEPKFDKAEAAISKAMKDGDVPGAVLLVGNRDGVVYNQAFGDQAQEPSVEPMKTDTIFDMASMSKSVGCATSIMILIDQGKMKLSDPVAKYIPEFAANGKEHVTIENLLIHDSGLTPDNSMDDYKDGADDAWKKIYALKPRWEPGTVIKYSDVGFIMLGKLVEVVSGKPLNEFAEENVFRPLKMKNTRYLPPADWKPRIAPTEKRSKNDADFIRGEVHDPRAFALGGFAGHAGLFSTTEDVSHWVRMLLNGGEFEGKRILSEKTVKDMLTPRCVGTGEDKACRGLGLDIDSGYSPSPRGGRFPVGTTFGHTGFTGTCFWADPETGVFYVLLASRLHPDGKGEVRELRRDVATDIATVMMGEKKN